MMSQFDKLKATAERLGIDYRQPGTSRVTFRLVKGSKLTVPAHKSLYGFVAKTKESPKYFEI